MTMELKFRELITQNAYEICERLINPLVEVGFHVSGEIEYLNKFYSEAKGIGKISLNGNYVLEVNAYCTHAKKWVWYHHRQCNKDVKTEVGDLLFLSRYKHIKNIVSEHAMITQAKCIRKDRCDVKLNQLSLYYYWLAQKTRINVKGQSLPFKATRYSFSPLLLINLSGSYPDFPNFLFPSNVGIASPKQAYNQLMTKFKKEKISPCSNLKKEVKIQIKPYLSLTPTLWRLLYQFIGEHIIPSTSISKLINIITKNPINQNEDNVVNEDKGEKPFVIIVFTVGTIG